MSFDFASLTYRPPTESLVPVVRPAKADPPKPTEPELPPETILELWQERTAIMASENPDSNTNVPPIPDDADWPTRHKHEKAIRRFWEIVASAEMSLIYGDYAGWIIRPHLTPAAEDADTIKGGEPMLEHRPA